MTSNSTNQSKGEAQFERHKNLKVLRKTDSFIFFAHGEALYKLRKDEAYKFTTGGVMTWEEYLKTPDVNLTNHQAQQMIDAYVLFCIGLKMTKEQMGEYPLNGIKFIVRKYKKGEFTKGKDIRHTLEASKELSMTDLREFFHDSYEKPFTEPEERTYEYVLMKRCVETGTMTRLHDYSSADIDVMLQRFEDK